MKVANIKQNAFCLEGYINVKNSTLIPVNKTRPNKLETVYKATEGYIISLTVEEQEQIYKKYVGKQLRNGTANYISTLYIIQECINQGLLPESTNGKYYLYNEDAPFCNLLGLDEEYITVWYREAFTKLPLTKKQQETKKALEIRHSMQNLTGIAVKDNIIDLLQKEGISCSSANNSDGDTLTYKSRKDYNRLVKKAIEYYLNHIVLTELGCEITVPKQKTTHCYNWYDPLCYVGDITFTTNEGAQNEETK